MYLQKFLETIQIFSYKVVELQGWKDNKTYVYTKSRRNNSNIQS